MRRYLQDGCRQPRWLGLAQQDRGVQRALTFVVDEADEHSLLQRHRGGPKAKHSHGDALGRQVAAAFETAAVGRRLAIRRLVPLRRAGGAVAALVIAAHQHGGFERLECAGLGGHSLDILAVLCKRMGCCLAALGYHVAVTTTRGIGFARSAPGILRKLGHPFVSLISRYSSWLALAPAVKSQPSLLFQN